MSVIVTARATEGDGRFTFPRDVPAEEIVRRLKAKGIDAVLGEDGVIDLDEAALKQLGFESEGPGA